MTDRGLDLGQFFYGMKLIAHFFPFGEKFIQDRGICGGGIVEEYDRSGMDSGQKFLKSFFAGWLLILDPVDIGETPEKCGITKFFCHGEVFCAVDTTGRTVEFCHGFTGHGFI